jgi:TM2 domain-containing membrane protein YozV
VNFEGAVIVDEHSTMVNFEIPKESIPHLAVAFRVMEENKKQLGVVDYALSQSTLEQVQTTGYLHSCPSFLTTSLSLPPSQVFLKKIRPNENDAALAVDQLKLQCRVPRWSDYFNAYLCWLLAFFLPGLHHFYLGNFWRGMKYLVTVNELFVGWFLDIFELHILVKKSVEEYGSQPVCGCSC